MERSLNPCRQRRWGFLFFLLSATSTAYGQTDTEAVLLSCLEETQNAARLDCYDQLARQVAAGTPTDSVVAPALSTDAAASSVTSVAPAAVVLPATQAQLTGTSVTSRIVSVSATPRGHRAFRLENGQIWIEVEVGRQPVSANQSVTINKRPRRWVMQLEDMPDIGVRLAESK